MCIRDRYKCYVYAYENGIRYGEDMTFQILSGKSKTIELRPFENVGKATITIVDYEDHPVVGVGVALLPYAHSWDSSHEEFLEDALFIQHTSTVGEVLFEKIPSSYSFDYSVYVFYDEENNAPLSDGFVVGRDAHQKRTVRVDL